MGYFSHVFVCTAENFLDSVVEAMAPLDRCSGSTRVAIGRGLVVVLFLLGMIAVVVSEGIATNAWI
jgi:hypothetical protein